MTRSARKAPARGWLVRLLLGIPAALIALLVLAPAASAHPLGNFTVNSYSGVEVQPEAVKIHLVVDSAEIPTIQQFPDADSGGGVSTQQADQYGEQECERLRPGLNLTLDGARQEFSLGSSGLEFLTGQAGLRTMRLTCAMTTSGDVGTAGHSIEYVDQNSIDRTGWREITATGNGVDLTDSTAPSDSVSDELTTYPQDLLTSPLDVRSMSTGVTPGDGIVTGADSPQSAQPTDSKMGALTESFTKLVSARELGLGFALFALALSILLGALHAFAPGHGKTLMAAYLIGQRSSLRQVGVIGLTVTLTHTAGVLVLGVLLSGFALTAPERIYGWLGIASGLLLLGIGVSLLRQARRRHVATPQQRAAELVAAGMGQQSQQTEHDHAALHDRAHDHDSAQDHALVPGHDSTHDHAATHGHLHDHADALVPDHDSAHDQAHALVPGHDSSHDHGAVHDHDSDHAHSHRAEVTHSHGWGGAHTHPAPATSARGLIAVGFAGGMVPSPSALIVLLGGIALGRAWFGVLLVIGYGIGMALALIGTGLALAHARDHVARWAERHRREGQESNLLLWLTRSLPMVTAALVMVVGIGLALRSAILL